MEVVKSEASVNSSFLLFAVVSLCLQESDKVAPRTSELADMLPTFTVITVILAYDPPH